MSEDGEVAVGEVGGTGDDHVIVHHHKHILVIAADVDGGRCTSINEVVQIYDFIVRTCDLE